MSKIVVNEKMTKKDVISAYKELEVKFKKAKADSIDNRTSVMAKRNVETVQVASNTSAEDIVRQLADLRLNTNSVISTIEESILEKKAQLEQLNSAIGLQNKELETVHGVIHSADSLAILIQANKQEMETFADDLLVAETAKKKAFADFDQSFEEMKKSHTKNTKRREEEFEYEFGLKKARQVDELNDERAASERATEASKREADEKFQARESRLLDAEEEITKLRTRFEEFPAELEAASEEASKKATERANKANSFQVRALEDKIKVNSDLTDSDRVGLTQRMVTLQEENTHLRKQLELANEKVVKVATEAISGAQQRIMPVAAVPATGTSGK